MSLITKLSMRDSAFIPHLNTGTLFDIQTGAFVPGTHGGMVLNGGLATSNSFMGRPKMFKSTEMFSYIMRAMCYYPDTDCIIDDTEQTLKKRRIAGFTPWDNQDDLYERTVLQTPVDFSLEEFFAQIKKIADEKLAHRDDYVVESPLIDPRNNQPLMIIKPTFIVVDSWSGATSTAAQNTLNTKELGSSDTNMVFMTDGRVKKMIMSQIPNLAARAGLYFCLSAHVGDKYEMNAYAQTPKVLPHMRMGDKPKGVGPDFNFLISNGIDMRSVKVLLDNDKNCLYPTLEGGAMELSEVTSIVTRGNNNMGGTQLSLVVSQINGILGDLSNYHYLRENDYFGLVGNKVTHKPTLTDVSLGRTTVRQKLQDPKVARAIELLAQLRYIQSNWTTYGTDVDLQMKPDRLAEMLLASDQPSVSDILQSRSYWTYDKSNTQPYMSLYDVLAIAQGVYRAKGIYLSGVKLTKPSTKVKSSA